MELDPVILSRLQFAFTVAFHILFPSLTMGLAAFLVFVEARWLKTGDTAWHDLYRFWVKVFALAFGMGVVSGIPMSFQFGTNWSEFSLQAGNVIGPLLGYEVLTAFFLEASFLGIMLFGWQRVGRRLHFIATLAVAIGTSMSAFWILSANSWMQTPQGFLVNAEGVFEVESWWAVIFNPSFPYRLAHMILASWLTTAFVVMAVCAWQVLKHRFRDCALKGLRVAVVAAALLAPLQIFVGDQHGLNTLEHQPVKVAAMEGNWETGPSKPLLLFAWPDQAAEENHAEIGIPNGASLILTHDPEGTIPGLKSVPPEDRPPVAVVFFAFRIMVGLGFLMLAVAWFAWLRRRTLQDRPGLLWSLVAMGPSGFLAVLAGWTVTEVGRQPWVVYGQMRVAEAISPVLHSEEVMTSLMLFAIVYSLIFATFIYFLARIIREGPAPHPDAEPVSMDVTAAMEGAGQ